MFDVAWLGYSRYPSDSLVRVFGVFSGYWKVNFQRLEAVGKKTPPSPDGMTAVPEEESRPQAAYIALASWAVLASSSL